MIERFRMLGNNIVVDADSGCVHVVTDTVWDILSVYESMEKKDAVASAAKSHGAGKALEAYDEVTALVEKGQLFSEDPFIDADLPPRKPVIKALCLLVSQSCNLHCRYCFAEGGGYGRDGGLMLPSVSRKAIDFLLKNSGNRRNLEVDFFGGEPLMNWDVVKSAVEYAERVQGDKNIRFTLTTNGLLLDNEKISFMNKHMRNVVLSIDGRRYVHDNMRPDFNGDGSYDKVLPLLKKFAASRGQDNYYVRGTFTRFNLDFASDVLHLADEGFKHISVEPVVASPDKDYSLRVEDVPRIKAEYVKLAEAILKRRREGRGFSFFHFNIDLTGGPCLTKRLSGCGAGAEYAAVTHDGKLYPCHQLVGDETLLLGDLDAGITNDEARERFASRNVYTVPDCKTCWARFFCGGGCAANALSEGGDILASHKIGCELERHRVKCALGLLAAE